MNLKPFDIRWDKRIVESELDRLRYSWVYYRTLQDINKCKFYVRWIVVGLRRSRYCHCQQQDQGSRGQSQHNGRDAARVRHVCCHGVERRMTTPSSVQATMSSRDLAPRRQPGFYVVLASASMTPSHALKSSSVLCHCSFRITSSVASG